jgi:hypothetical protein
MHHQPQFKHHLQPFATTSQPLLPAISARATLNGDFQQQLQAAQGMPQPLAHPTTLNGDNAKLVSLSEVPLKTTTTSLPSAISVKIESEMNLEGDSKISNGSQFWDHPENEENFKKRRYNAAFATLYLFVSFWYSFFR